MRTSVLAAILLATAFGLNAASPSRTPGEADEAYSVVVAQGSGKDEKEAKRAAFRDAVSRVVGTLVDAETLVKNDEVVEERILEHSGGFIKTYDVIKSEKTADGLVRIQIKATVERSTVLLKLADAKVATKQVRGPDLLAEKLTKQDARKNATELIAKLMEELPKVARAEVRGKPRLSPAGDGVIVDIEASVDPKAYKVFAERAVGLLDKVASVREPGTFEGIAGCVKLFNSPDEDFPDPTGSAPPVPPGNYTANAFKTAMNRELVRRSQGAGFAVWLMTGREDRGERTKWTYYRVEADYDKAIQASAGEPKVSVKLLDKDGRAIAESQRPLLRLVGQDGFGRYHRIEQVRFLASVFHKKPRAIDPRLVPKDLKSPFSPVVMIAPLAMWSTSIVSEPTTAYSPVLRFPVLFKQAPAKPTDTSGSGRNALEH
jgi:hypothetical protein